MNVINIHHLKSCRNIREAILLKLIDYCILD